MEVGNALTLEQALDMDIADERESNLVPVQQSPQEDHYDLPYDPEGDLHSENGLTLEQAMEVYKGDDDNAVAAPKLNPSSAVAVIDGHPVSLSEMVQAYADKHRLHAAGDRLTEEYHAVQTAAQGVVNAAWELSRFMVAQMPPAPHEAVLHVNPDEYVRQKAIHDHAMQSVEHVLSQAQIARVSADDIAQRYHKVNLQAENAKLVQHFPETADLGRRQAFFNRMLDVAYACGFSRAEFEQVIDHRIFRLGALALKGMEAIAEAPKPKEKRRQRRRRYSEAMERLERTGSIEDAVMVDFD